MNAILLLYINGKEQSSNAKSHLKHKINQKANTANVFWTPLFFHCVQSLYISLVL